jgi:hypothetical protein
MGPRCVSRGRERGATVQDKALCGVEIASRPEAGFPSRPLLRRVPSPAVGGGRARAGADPSPTHHAASASFGA